MTVLPHPTSFRFTSRGLRLHMELGVLERDWPGPSCNVKDLETHQTVLYDTIHAWKTLNLIY